MLFWVLRWADLCCYLVLDWAVIRGAKILFKCKSKVIKQISFIFIYIYIYIYIEKMSFELCNHVGLRVERKF